jgi:hypothetical protein
LCENFSIYLQKNVVIVKKVRKFSQITAFQSFYLSSNALPMAWRASCGVLAFNTSQPAALIPGSVDHLRIQSAVAMRREGWRKKQRRRFPFLKVGGF